jgi:hypothetical protein
VEDAHADGGLGGNAVRVYATAALGHLDGMEYGEYAAMEYLGP